MTFVIDGWEIAPLNDWYTSDGRLSIRCVYEGCWDICALNDEDEQLSEQSGLFDAFFSGPRIAAQSAHVVLGTSTQLVRAVPARYLITGTRWIIFRPDHRWQLDYIDDLDSLTEHERQLDGYQGKTLRAVAEHFIQTMATQDAR